MEKTMKEVFREVWDSWPCQAPLEPCQWEHNHPWWWNTKRLLCKNSTLMRRFMRHAEN